MPGIEVQHTKDFVLARTEMHAQEIVRERWRGQHRRTGSVPLRQERLRPIEDIGRLRFAKSRTVADVESGHGSWPWSAGRDCPVPAPHAAAQPSMIEDRREAARESSSTSFTARTAWYPARAPQARPLLSHLPQFERFETP